MGWLFILRGRGYNDFLLIFLLLGSFEGGHLNENILNFLLLFQLCLISS